MKLNQLQEAKLALRRKQLSDFRRGDKILIVRRSSRRGTEKRIAEVRIINHNDLGLITYGPAYHNDYLSSGQGAFDPTELGKYPYGIIDVEMFKRTTRTYAPGAIREAKSVESDIIEWVRRQVNKLGLGETKYKQIPNRADEAINILTKLFRQDPEQTPGSHPYWNIHKGNGSWRIVVRVDDYFSQDIKNVDHLAVRRYYTKETEKFNIPDLHEARYHRRDFTIQTVYQIYKKHERYHRGGSERTATSPTIRATHGGGFIQPQEQGYGSVDAARLIFDFPSASSREQNMQFVKDFIRDNKLPYTGIRFSFVGHFTVLVDFVEEDQ